MTMRRFAVGLATLMTVSCAVAREIVVSSDGLSPAEALVAARAAKAADPREPVTVRVTRGVHPLTETLRFTAADSGIVWKGEKNALLAGGTFLKDWQDDAPGIVSAPAPRRADGSLLFFEQLWVDGRRATRSVFPKQGWLSPSACDERAEPGAGGRSVFRDTLAFDSPDVRAFLATLTAEERPYVRLCVRTKWAFTARPVERVEAEKGVVESMAAVGWKTTPWKKWDAKSRVTFENARAGFTAPGDWLYDVSAGRIRYRLRPGETKGSIRVLAPTAGLTTLVSIDGAHDLRFENLAFGVTAIPSARDDGVAAMKPYVRPGVTRTYMFQSASAFDAAVMAKNLRRTVFASCRFAQTGNGGLRLEDGCVSNVITRCRFDDLGGTAIWIGATKPAFPPDAKPGRAALANTGPTACAFNRVQDCRLSEGGRTNPEGAGIVIAHASDCVVTHNDIWNFDYTGVSVGWSWGYRGSVAQRNTVSYNRIWNLGRGRMDDLAGIYTLGTSFGTKIVGNVIHDIRSVNYGGWGIYNDEGSEGIVIEQNLVYRTDDGGYNQHYGVGNEVRNNIFVDNRRDGAVRIDRPTDPKGEVRSDSRFARNIVVVRGKGNPLVNPRTLTCDCAWTDNLWWSDDAADRTCLTIDRRGAFADPQFVDPAKDDYRLKPSSPAFARGFASWDVSAAGVREVK